MPEANENQNTAPNVDIKDKRKRAPGGRLENRREASVNVHWPRSLVTLRFSPVSR